MSTTKSDKDTLHEDVMKIVHEDLGLPEDYGPFIESLFIYIKKRDRMIFNHAYQLGKEQHGNQTKD